MSMASSDTLGVGQAWMTATSLTKSYGGVHALRGADLDLVPGEVHGIIGPNGAGKSTLVKMLAGVERPDSGTIGIDGEEADLSSPLAAQRQRIVLMPQEIALVPDSTLADNIVLGAEPRRRGIYQYREARRRAVAAMDAVDMHVDPSSLTQDLSTVHRRLLMLARAIDRNTRLLILDEPTAGLASHEAEVVAATVSRLKAHGVTVIYISHHLTEVADLCDRVTCVREGRVAATLDKHQITKDALVGLLLGTPAGAGMPGDASLELDPTPRADRSTESGIALEGRSLSGSRLRDVSFVAPANSVTGVTGLLGSGVSEFVAVVAGGRSPAAGTLEVNGAQRSFSSPADAQHHGIGYLAGDRSTMTFSDMSVRENVSIAALEKWFGRFRLIRKSQERSQVSAILASLGVKVQEEGAISALSGGNQQRALVGRLIASQVQCLVLDEPTVGVDIHARETIWRTIKALAATRTVVLASSEPDELVATCDRVLCFHDGRIVAELTGREITVEAITRAIT